MKKKSDDLFQLIKSLTPNEKRYFKLSRKQDGETNYMRLFDAIDAMDDDEYDEEIIREKFKGEQFLSNLHTLKHHLYSLILKSLRNSKEENFIESQLYNLLSEAAILQERGLFKLSENQLKKALRIAQKHDKQLIILEILRRQLSNLIEMGVKNVTKSFETHWQLIDKVLANIVQEYNYTKLHYGLMIPLRHGMRRDPDLDTKIAWITDDTLFNKPPEKPRTFETELYRLSMFVTYYFLKYDIPKAFVYQQELIDHWRAYPDMIKHRPRLYLIQLSNYINCKISIEQYDGIEDVVQEMDNLKLQSFRDKAERFHNVKNQLLRYYMNTRQYGKAEVLVPKIKEGLELYGSKINEARLIAIYYHILTLNFILEKHEACIEWIDKILNNDRTTPQKEAKQIARIFELAVHYEMDNHRVLDSLFESTYKKLKRSNALMGFEKQVLKHFKKLAKTTDDKEKKRKLLQEFLHELEQSINNGNPMPAGFTEIYLWVKSKLENKPLRDLI